MDSQCLRPDELCDLSVDTLGKAEFDSPLIDRKNCCFEDDNQKVMLYSGSENLAGYETLKSIPMMEKAGPRKKIFFDPAKLSCGIVTCGGLCPGLNDVIRTITLTLQLQYGVKDVYGFKYGYMGMISNAPQEPIKLTPHEVDEIHLKGGDILSSSRGTQDVGDIIDNLVKRNIGIVFAIGGDGTLTGASAIAKEIKKRGLKISVIGVPKTIDNDIFGIEKSFGFSTAVEAARSAVCGAHEEAKGAWNGIGLVKLMGRDSGFIAAYATLANSDVNFCFVPEVELKLDGENGFLSLLEKRIERKHHGLIVVAEGAGQNLMAGECRHKDASGNVLHADIGMFLKIKIQSHFEERGIPLVLKYIDPSYIIRSVPANSEDSAFCLMLGQYAVHAGMAGKTDMVIGYWNQYFTHIPISLATLKRKKIDTQGHLWQTVLRTTGQEREPEQC